MNDMDTLETINAYCETLASIQDFLPRCLQLLVGQTNSQIGFLSLLNEEDKSWLRYSINENVDDSRIEKYGQGFRVSPHPYPRLSAHVMAIGTAYRCGNIQGDPLCDEIGGKIQSVLIVPILASVPNFLGLINLASYQQDFYTQRDEEWVTDIAEHIRAPLRKLRERTHVSGSPRQRALEDSATLSLRSFATSRDFLQATLQTIETRIDAPMSFARIVDGKNLVFAAACGVDISSPEQEEHHRRDFLKIGGDELTKQERSAAGYVAYTKAPQRLDNVDNAAPFYKGIYKKVKSVLCVPILLGDVVLGTITLLNTQPHCYTPQDEEYLGHFMRFISGPLDSLLRCDGTRTFRREVRNKFKEDLWKMAGIDLLSDHHTAHMIAKHIAEILHSNLCTIWLLNLGGSLLWHGEYGVSCDPQDQCYEKKRSWARQAIRDAFGVEPHTFTPGLEATRNAMAWGAMDGRKLRNYGPNRHTNGLSLSPYLQPFLLAPLIAYDKQLIGVIHVGLKQLSPENPHRLYSEADEFVLESIQREIVYLFERQQLRDTADYAAADLHDALGLITYDLLYAVDAARFAIRNNSLCEAETTLDTIERKAQSLTGELRSIIGGLRSHILENKGIVGALREYIEKNIERPGLETHFLPKGKTQLPIRFAWQLYRIAQEGLANVVKHAQASQVYCALDVSPTEVCLCIRDNGIGLSRPSQDSREWHGLSHLQQRVDLLGGQLDIQSESPHGTRLTITVPLARGTLRSVEC